MQHFFVKPEQIFEGRARIEGEDHKHISRVLRMKPGEELMISDGSDWDYLCRIESIGEEEILLKIEEENISPKELPSKLFLFQALPKSDKMELIIQKAVELGVYEIIPFISRRVIVKLDEKKIRSKLQRWRAIALSAAKQSGRSIIPEIKEPMDFQAALCYAKDFDRKLIPYELADDIRASANLLSSIKKNENIAVFIGPEGGFEKGEIEAAKDRGFEAITLGGRILRTETAGFVILSNLMLRLEAERGKENEESGR
ncbi:MAG: 16S rRNA (uracil(1498)-N(3))-methyltransferase [Johnsonella sp.]|nr:16S rRNA (uracil(1498)-N(3))-methyltransferase [Johnsonella sp.]